MTPVPRILLLDDDAQVRRPIELFLVNGGYEVVSCADGREGLKRLSAERFDLIITDLRMPHVSGVQLLEFLRSTGSTIPVIVVTAFSSVESAVEAMKLGAADYVSKPPQLDEIAIRIRKLLDHRSLIEENRRLRAELKGQFSLEGFVGKSDAVRRMLAKVEGLCRDGQISVLLTGESGTGKELIARAIHYNGPRSSGPFVPVNASALPETLFENELFGHEKGAFTGAVSEKKGLFEAANGGTLFLDEIGAMPLPSQAKLLRAIEDREVRRVGGTKQIPVDVRFITASNEDIEQLVESSKFRRDLYFRLAVASLEVPPLRCRGDDIRLLAEHFLARYNAEKARSVKFGRGVLDAMESYVWPGNVRELEHLVEMLVVTIGSDVIETIDLPQKITANASPDKAGRNLRSASKQVSERFERDFIQERLTANRWNIAKTARSIGISRGSLYSKMKEYGLEPSDAGDDV